ncbi:MAG: hypothetical protein ABSD42_06865 [Candidatus Bathyarchaeia archaeon]|jgi:hypothetical protein
MSFSLTVKAHNLLKSISIFLIAIGSVSASLINSLPDAAYVGIFVALCGAVGYALANILVDPTASTVTVSAESIASAFATAVTAAKAVPPQPSAKSVLQQLIDNPAQTVAEAEAVFNQASTNYKAAVAAATSPTTMTTGSTYTPPASAPAPT